MKVIVSNASTKLRKFVKSELEFYANLPEILALNFFAASFLFVFIKMVLSVDAMSFDLCASLVNSIYTSLGFALLGLIAGSLLSERMQSSKLQMLKRERKKRKEKVNKEIKVKLQMLEGNPTE